MPALLQDAPALAAALAEICGERVDRESIVKKIITFLFIGQLTFST
jgi:hypothetical protein